jgi:hypothetical protein
MTLQDSIPNLLNNEKVAHIQQNFLNFNRKYLSDYKLLLYVVICISIIYFIFAVFNTFFKLPVILILGTIMGLYLYKNN